MSNVSGRSWPSKRLPDQFGAPSNAATGGVPDLPKPRNSAAATQAMDILSDAVWRIDARDHQNAGAPLKLVRNLGTGGSVLDCRTGSTSVPDTNDPLFLPAEQSAYVYLPGGSANNMDVSSPPTVTGDLEIILDIAADDWTPAAQQYVVNKSNNSTGGNRCYSVRIETDGKISLLWSVDGTNLITQTSTVANTFIDGQRWKIKITLDIDNGASGYDVKFFTSSDGSTWTQLGSTKTGGSTTSIFAGTDGLRLGAWVGTTGGSWSGRYYRAIIKDGIDGTTVLDVDTSVLTTGSTTSFTAATGQTVTINRSTSGRKTVVVPSADVKKVDDANVYLPGVTGNYLSTPNAAALQITGDIDLRACIAPDTLTPSGNQYAIWRATSSLSNISYGLGLTSTGLIRFFYSTNGTSLIGINSTTAVPYTAGRQFWIRATFDVDNGASGNDAKFYTSQDGLTWTQLGTTVTAAGTVTINAGTAALTLSAVDTTLSVFAGRIYRAQVLDGIDGTTVLDIDCTVAPTNFTPGYAAAFPAVTGQTVTMNSTAGSAMRVNSERYAAGSPVWLFGTDDYMEVPMSATGSKLLDFGPNDSFTVLAVVRQWATPVNNQRIVSKSSLNSVGGVTIRQNGTNYSYSNTILDGSTTVNPISPTGSSGSLAVVAVTANRFGQLGTSWLNAAAGTPLNIAGVGPVASSRALRIGVESGASTGYADMEFMGAGIWRRVLSPAEQATVASFYNARIA